MRAPRLDFYYIRRLIRTPRVGFHYVCRLFGAPRLGFHYFRRLTRAPRLGFHYFRRRIRALSSWTNAAAVPKTLQISTNFLGGSPNPAISHELGVPGAKNAVFNY